MNVIYSIRTFLSVARLGSFSAAAREAGTVPSVISKRIAQLEAHFHAQFFIRSTRGLELTEAGRNFQHRFMSILSELEDAMDSATSRVQLQEHVRIKCPTTFALLHVADVLCDFRLENPGVRIDLVLLDRSVNPLEEGFDIAIGALPASYPHVLDVPLCPLPRKMVASPSYIARHGKPEHPRDISSHDCVTFSAAGDIWTFEGPNGEVAVEVREAFKSSDSSVLRAAAVKGVGITIVSVHTIQDELDSGKLIEILPKFPVPDLFVKALVPERRRSNPTVSAILEALISASASISHIDRN